jgi:NAD(P)-dependent dehydrogenase (short-subunit alcohol dehydrogenase family)
MLAEEEVRVVVVDIADSKGEEVVESIREKRKEATFIHCDVSRAEDVKKAVENTVDAYRRLDILVNNAAVTTGSGDAPVSELQEERWDKLLSVDLKSVYLCCKYAIPEMIKSGGGSIVNISSIQGLGGSRVNPIHAYAISKAGVISLTKCVAVHYGRQKIRCNAICPGIIETSPRSEWDQKKLEAFIQGMPLGSQGIGTPEDVAYLVLFLASEKARLITGAVVSIDGGASAAITL